MAQSFQSDAFQNDAFEAIAEYAKTPTVPGLRSPTLEFYRTIRRNVPGWTLKQGVPSNEKLKKIFGPHAR
jgi:hypothetical protein